MEPSLNPAKTTDADVEHDPYPKRHPKPALNPSQTFVPPSRQPTNQPASARATQKNTFAFGPPSNQKTTTPIPTGGPRSRLYPLSACLWMGRNPGATNAFERLLSNFHLIFVPRSRNSSRPGDFQSLGLSEKQNQAGLDAKNPWAAG